MRQRDSELNSYWGTICTPLQLRSPDGKMRKTNCANTEGIFRYRFLLIYLLGSSCKQMQRHRALGDAKLAGMIWLEMEKI